MPVASIEIQDPEISQKRLILKVILIILTIDWIILPLSADELLYLFIRSPKFNFYDFDTTNQAQAYMNAHYPNGTDVGVFLEDMESAGARCQYTLRKNIGVNPQYADRYHCHYSAGILFTISPMAFFNIVVYSDANGDMVSQYITRHSTSFVTIRYHMDD